MRISSFGMWVLAIMMVGLAACGDDGGGGGEELTCADYCTSIMANCTATNQQYGNVGECMSTCGQFPAGTAADLGGNTLGCRTYHAGAAMTGPAVHCRHAGPGGDGVCGANCESFCTLVLGVCTGANIQYNGDMNTCMTACGGYATDPPYNSMQTGGNTFACRLYHATMASANPAGHCSHTSSVGLPPCN